MPKGQCPTTTTLQENIIPPMFFVVLMMGMFIPNLLVHQMNALLGDKGVSNEAHYLCTPKAC
jgi:hypothetical protein